MLLQGPSTPVFPPRHPRPSPRLAQSDGGRPGGVPEGTTPRAARLPAARPACDTGGSQRPWLPGPSARPREVPALRAAQRRPPRGGHASRRGGRATRPLFVVFGNGSGVRAEGGHDGTRTAAARARGRARSDTRPSSDRGPPQCTRATPGAPGLSGAPAGRAETVPPSRGCSEGEIRGHTHVTHTR